MAMGTTTDGGGVVYGAVAAEHLEHPRNLGKLADANGVGRVDEPATDTLVTVYLKLGCDRDGRRVVTEARFRAFGCGGCIIAGSIATELVRGLTLAEVSRLDSPTILRALEDGLPPDQRYCADLTARAVRSAAEAAGRSTGSGGSSG
ncbi:MAG: iron-sulfur cluster assembly scaffold protein [Chloroflexota bacterium]